MRAGRRDGAGPRVSGHAGSPHGTEMTWPGGGRNQRMRNRGGAWGMVRLCDWCEVVLPDAACAVAPPDEDFDLDPALIGS